MSLLRLISVIVFILIFNNSNAQINYYVSNKGNNNNNGLTLQQSFSTLQYAANFVNAGDTVFVLNGIYSGFDLRKSGGQNSPIVFKAIGDSVVINLPNSFTSDGINVENSDWVIIDGFNVIDQPRAGIRIAVSDNVIVKNNRCTNNYRWGIFTGFTDDILIENNVCTYSQKEHGIYVSNSGDRPIVRNNQCFENSGCGIQLNADISMGGDGIISNAVIEGNIIHDNGNSGGSAINLDCVQNSQIYNNLIYNNHTTGIALYRGDGAEGSINNKVFNNTIINPSNARWNILIVNGSTENVLYNNILINSHNFRGSISIDESSVLGFISDYNILVNRLSNDDGTTNMNLAIWQSLGFDLNSRIADLPEAIFVNYANNDFHLTENSQAVNAGTSNVSLVVTRDLDNNLRPQGKSYDIGAYEYNDVTSVYNDEISESYILYQNYPNPFNPVTKIKYAIPSEGSSLMKFVQLKVYDILGNEVATLVNEEKPAGNYEVEFNESGLTSGIYFYCLHSGNFTDTKKFLLLK